MGISYNNSKLVPASFLDLKKNYLFSNDGTPIGSTYTMRLDGTILPYKGSPTSSGTFWVASGAPPDESLSNTDDWMEALIRKQEAIRGLFANEGKVFRVDGFDGYSYLSCNPRIKALSFPQGQQISWAHKMNYSVDLEADVIYLFDTNYSGYLLTEDSGIVSGFKLDSAEENWNIEPTDENQPIFRLSHQINAKGKRFYNAAGTLVQPAWQNARDWVLSRLGLNYDRLYASGVLNLTGYSGYNYVRSTQQNDMGGTYAVTETWLCFAPAISGWHATEEFDINVRVDESNLTSVTLNGKIQGAEVRNNTTRGPVQSNKFENASGYYVNQAAPYFLSRAQNIAGMTLNSTILQQTVGFNQLTGVITYNIEYNNRASTSISGAKSEKISVSYKYAVDIWAEVPIIGRAAGPIQQELGTKTSNVKTVTIEAIMPASRQGFASTQPDTNTIISGYKPSGPTWVIQTANDENFTPNDGRYQRTMSWRYNS